MGDELDNAGRNREAEALFAALGDPYSTLDMIRPMVERNPRLVRTRDGGGIYLPLHVALITARPESSVTFWNTIRRQSVRQCMVTIHSSSQFTESSSTFTCASRSAKMLTSRRRW
jgi:hypothetical protein